MVLVETLTSMNRATKETQKLHGRDLTPRFKSLIKKYLFILIVYGWPLADEVT